MTRLQLGVSRLELLDDKILSTFLNKTWIHFGDTTPEEKISPFQKFNKILKSHGLHYTIKKIIQQQFIARNKKNGLKLDVNDLYNQTNFQDFYYQKGDRLPFEDESIDFIFSEHFFEHLFFDEALALFKECGRVLKPKGVIRTCVPDADLRTYEPPERSGFPSKKLPFTNPHKHKTRWSIYSLEEAYELAGLKSIPLHYCNKSGEYIKVKPSDIANQYEGCPEEELIFDFTYIQRLDSLIVDGIKKN